MLFDIVIGQQLLWHGQPYEVLNVLGTTVTLIGVRIGRTHSTTLDALRQAQQDGKLKLQGQAISREALLPVLAMCAPGVRAVVQHRLRYVHAVLDEPQGYGSRRIIHDVIQRVISDGPMPSTSSVYNWVRIFLNSGRDPLSLVPRHAEKGCREVRFCDSVADLIDQAIDEYYLTLNRPSIKDTHAWLVSAVLAANQMARKIPLVPPSYEALCRWIRYRVDPYWTALRRVGRQAANRKFRGRGEGVVSTYPLERVEIDHTVLDVLVVHPVTRAVLGRPVFTWALDHYSRVILGTRLSLEPASTVSALICIEQIVRDKTSDLLNIPQLDGFRWDLCGTPRAVIMDNGPEFHAENFTEACGRYAIDLQYCPPGQPWFKGRCERFARSLNQGLIHLLPGTTRSNPTDRAGYPSEKLACLTMEEVEKLIKRWIVGIYHQRRHRTLGMSPTLAWQEGVAEHPVPQISPMHNELALALSKTVTISGGRFQLDNRLYHSSSLVALEAQLSKAHRKVQVFYHHHDVYYAYVVDPVKQVPLKVPCVTAGVHQGMTLDQYQLLRRASKQSESAEGATALQQAQRAIQLDVQQAHKAAEKALTSKNAKSKRGKNSGLNNKELARAEGVLDPAITPARTLTPSRWAAYDNDPAEVFANPFEVTYE